MPDESITSIAHVIQLSVAPVFLLSGIAALLNVLTNRLARIVDRAAAYGSAVSIGGTRPCGGAAHQPAAAGEARALGQLGHQPVHRQRDPDQRGGDRAVFSIPLRIEWPARGGRVVHSSRW